VVDFWIEKERVIEIKIWVRFMGAKQYLFYIHTYVHVYILYFIIIFFTVDYLSRMIKLVFKEEVSVYLCNVIKDYKSSKGNI
jgi:hypothetical protein